VAAIGGRGEYTGGGGDGDGGGATPGGGDGDGGGKSGAGGGKVMGSAKPQIVKPPRVTEKSAYHENDSPAAIGTFCGALVPE
jgi:hypothetical protein